MLRRALRFLLLATLLVLTRAGTAFATEPRARDDHAGADRIAALLAIEEGTTVAVFGPGGNHLLDLLAIETGPRGKVYAVDSDPAVVGAFEITAAKSGRPNIVPLLVHEGQQLPEPVALALLVNEYRNLDNRSAFFATLRKSMADHGKVAVIDYYRRKGDGPPVKERVASHTVTRELSRFGLTIRKRHHFLRNQYFFVAEWRRK
jgi:hypothetical protein